jgi:hypothetical protein
LAYYAGEAVELLDYSEQTGRGRRLARLEDFCHTGGYYRLPKFKKDSAEHRTFGMNFHPSIGCPAPWHFPASLSSFFLSLPA